MRRAVWVGLVAVVIGVVAGTIYVATSTDDGHQNDAVNAQSSAGELIAAAHPDCASTGVLVANYLRTGDTHGHPELDTYATLRARVLSQPAAARDGVIRQYADRAITSCDDNEKAQEDAATKAAQQQAKDDADARAAAAAQQAADDQAARFAAACASHGGTLGTYRGDCFVDYPGWSDQRVAIDADGNFDQTQADLARTNCDTGMQDAVTSAAEGHPWERLPEYHPDTGVCVPGAP